jgi:hypothetical protein
LSPALRARVETFRTKLPADDYHALVVLFGAADTEAETRGWRAEELHWARVVAHLGLPVGTIEALWWHCEGGCDCQGLPAPEQFCAPPDDDQGEAAG